MRHRIIRRGPWLGGLLLLLSIAHPATAQDERKPAQGNWFSRVFGGGKKDAPRKERDAAQKPGEVNPDVRSSRAQITVAKTTYFRRLEVCNKLRAVALQTGDDALMQRAEQLEARVWDSYQDQLKRLAQNSNVLSPEEQALDTHLGIDSGLAGGRTPAGTSEVRSVSGSGRAERR